MTVEKERVAGQGTCQLNAAQMAGERCMASALDESVLEPSYYSPQPGMLERVIVRPR